MTQQNQIGKHKTKVFDRGNWKIVKYHNTEVVRFRTENNSVKRIVLNSGGYRTLTTKTRMNQASCQFNLGILVYQANSKWFIDFQGNTYDFEDGIVLCPA